MYVATQHREDPNLFFVTPVDESGDADANNTFAVRMDDPSWWAQFDGPTQQLIQKAISDAKGGTKKDSDRPSAPEAPRGRDAFNMQFDSWSPSGFKASYGFGTRGDAWNNYNPSGFNASDGFGTRGDAWNNYNPSGWGSLGGWSLYPDAYSWGQADVYGNPVTNAAYALSLSRGGQPMGQAPAQIQQTAQQTSQLMGQNAQQKPQPGTMAYLKYIEGKPVSEW